MHAPRNPDNPEEEGEEGEGTSQGDNLVMRKMRMVRFPMLSSPYVYFQNWAPQRL